MPSRTHSRSPPSAALPRCRLALQTAVLQLSQHGDIAQAIAQISAVNSLAGEGNDKSNWQYSHAGSIMWEKNRLGSTEPLHCDTWKGAGFALKHK